MSEWERSKKLARARLRDEVHRVFDRLWKKPPEYRGRFRGQFWRRTCYEWLACQLGVPEPEAHFAAMDTLVLLRARAVLENATEQHVCQWADGMGRRSWVAAQEKAAARAKAAAG